MSVRQSYYHPWRGNVPYLSRRATTKARPAPRWHHWSEDEDAILRRLAGKQSAASIAKLLSNRQQFSNRTERAVWARAQRLKLSMLHYAEHNHSTKHSEETVERVRTLHDQGITPKVIAASTGIPLKTVERFVYYLGRLGKPTRASANAR